NKMRHSIKLLTLVAIILANLAGTAFAADFRLIGYDEHNAAWRVDSDSAHRYRSEHLYAVDLTIGSEKLHVAIDYFNHTYATRYADGSWGGFRDIKDSMMMAKVLHWLDNANWQINS